MSSCFQSWNKSISATFLIFALFTNVYAQDDKLLAEFNTSTGLPSNTVRCIKLDSLGRIWTGTDHGLNISNANSPIQRNIVKSVGNKSIWAINFLDSLVFIGTRYDGLFIFNIYTSNLYKYYPTSSINQIRKIKIFGQQVFILTNDGPYEFINQRLIKLPLTSNIEGDFLTDMFEWNNNIYGLDYPSRQIVKFSNGSFQENVIELFFGKNNPLAVKQLFCATVDKNKIYFGSDNHQLIISAEVGKQAKLLASFNQIGLSYVVWDLKVIKDKIVAAIGDSYSSTKGFLYIQDLNSPQNFYKITDYLTCLEADKVHNSLYYGTINSGMFLQRGIANCVGINKPEETNIISNDKEVYFYNNSLLKTFDANIYKTSNFKSIKDSITNATLSGDTLVYANQKSIIVYNTISQQPIYTIPKHQYVPIIGFVSELQLINNSLFAFVNYGGIFKYNLKTHIGEWLKNVGAFSPHVKKIGDRMILFNQEKGFNVLNEDSAYSLTSSDKTIAFASDFTIIGDTLYVLKRNRLEAFFINYKAHKLVFLKSFPIDEMLEGFAPQWLLSKNNQLYILNENGVIRFSTAKGIPIGYYYFGKYFKVCKPIISGDSLVFVSNTILSKIGFNDINKNNLQIDNNNLGLNYPESVNENLEFKITVSYPDYQVQNHFLKSLEVWHNGKLIDKKFTTGNQFTFNNGMKYGDYELILNIGYTQLKQKLSITLPISRNPYFFGFILIFVLTSIVIYIKAALDKKELNKKLFENRLQILKQNLNPHFVYNSMNLISSLILEEKNDEAVQVVAEFSNLQRTYLEINNKNIISLEEELKFLNDYLKLQHHRFHLDNDFEYSIDINPKIDTATVMLPPLILQPLAENAIKYGIIFSEALEKKIRIDVNGENPIVIGIEDNGTKVDHNNNGMGLGQKLVLERATLFSHSMNRSLKVYFGLPPKYSDSGYRTEIHVYS